MTAVVFVAVLLAASLHAGLNALIKAGIDPFIFSTLTMAMAGILAVAGVVVLPMPEPAAWPYLILSSFLNLGFLFALSKAYRIGDLSQVYPIARGTAPLLTALVSTFLLGERLPWLAWLGILTLIAGVMLISRRGGRDIAQFERRAVAYALATAVLLSCCSLVDGLGGRASGHAVAYALWLFIIGGAVMLAAAMLLHGPTVVPYMTRHWKLGLTGAGFALVNYSISIWAMTQAPIALVAAVRECSVLFAAAIAVVILGEPLRASRVTAALLIVSGLIIIRLS